MMRRVPVYILIRTLSILAIHRPVFANNIEQDSEWGKRGNNT
jgi:hypothetical protein